VAMIGKFKHLQAPEIAVLQEQVDRRFHTRESHCARSA
jgi:hypothetical protein